MHQMHCHLSRDSVLIIWFVLDSKYIMYYNISMIFQGPSQHKTIIVYFKFICSKVFHIYWKIDWFYILRGSISKRTFKQHSYYLSINLIIGKSNTKNRNSMIPDFASENPIPYTVPLWTNDQKSETSKREWDGKMKNKTLKKMAKIIAFICQLEKNDDKIK